MLQARSTVNGSETQQDRDESLLFFAANIQNYLPIRLYIAFWS